MEKNCIICGALYKKKITESKKYWSQKLFCSRRCSHKNKFGKCVSKNTQFQTGEYKLGNIEHRYDCRCIHCLPKKGSLNNFWKGGGTLKKCLFCGIEFEIEKHREKTAKFCSRKCTNSSRIGKPFGRPFPQKLSTRISRLPRKELQKRIRELPEYLKWRKAIMIRDVFKCVLCGVGGRLQVDHIIPFWKILDESIITSVEEAVQTKELWDLNNGRTLCEACHKLTPTYATIRKTK